MFYSQKHMKSKYHDIYILNVEEFIFQIMINASSYISLNWCKYVSA